MLFRQKERKCYFPTLRSSGLPVLVPLAGLSVPVAHDHAGSGPSVLRRDDLLEDHLVVVHQNRHRQQTGEHHHRHREADGEVDGGRLREDQRADGPVAGEGVLLPEPEGEGQEEGGR